MTMRMAVACLLLVLGIAVPALAGQPPEPAADEHAHHQGMVGHAQDAHAEHRRMMEEAGSGQAKPTSELYVKVQLYDLELRDQDGKPVKLKSDVIGDKLVAMTFIYSSCTTICPIYSALFTQVQELLGDRLGREVVLVTLTLDPTTDVPLRLKREARKYRAKPGWFYLTGEKNNVDQVLRGLDAYFADFTQHPPMALVGDGRTGTWKRYNGFPKPAQVVGMLDELEAARGEAGEK